jgi:VWFA-related protein
MALLKWPCAFFLCFALSTPAQGTSPPSPESGQSAAPARTPPVTLIPRSHEERESRYRAVHRIILNVRASDASGNPVTGLDEGDFTLLDDRHSRNLSSFKAVNGSAGSAFLHVMLMLDTVNNSARSVAFERREIERFLAQSPGRLSYPTSIAILSEFGARVSQSLRDRDALAGEFRELAMGVHPFQCSEEGNGSTQEFSNGNFGTSILLAHPTGSQAVHLANCLNQRFQVSLTELNKLARQQVDVPGRLILIWIGPGWPLLSGSEFGPDTASIRQNFFDYLVELSTELREAQVTLDAVSSPDLLTVAERRSDHDNLLINGVPTEDQVTAGSLALQILAHQTGGQILDQSKDIAGEITRCVADAESYYVLSFDSAPEANPGEYRSLQVTVDKPGVTVRTNTGYYAQP